MHNVTIWIAALLFAGIAILALIMNRGVRKKKTAPAEHRKTELAHFDSWNADSRSSANGNRKPSD